MPITYGGNVAKCARCGENVSKHTLHKGVKPGVIPSTSESEQKVEAFATALTQVWTKALQDHKAQEDEAWLRTAGPQFMIGALVCQKDGQKKVYYGVAGNPNSLLHDWRAAVTKLGKDAVAATPFDSLNHWHKGNWAKNTAKAKDISNRAVKSKFVPGASNNVPGNCAAPRMIQQAINDGMLTSKTTAAMTECWWSIPSIGKYTKPDGTKYTHGRPNNGEAVASCDTCAPLLPQLLCDHPDAE